MRNFRFWSQNLRALACAAGLAAASAASATTLLDWATHPWSPTTLPGPPPTLTQTFPLPTPNGIVDVTIRVSTTPSMTGTPGSFEGYSGFGPQTYPCNSVTSPSLDGAPAPTTYSSNLFGAGDKLDLGILFDPAKGNNQSVLIDIYFTEMGTGTPTTLGTPRPVSTLKFQISDIDWSQAGIDCLKDPDLDLADHGQEGWRADQVVITANNNGTPVTAFVLSAFASPATFTIDNTTKTATAIGSRFGGMESGSPMIGDDRGTMIVDFRSTFVTHVRITYNEAAYDKWCDRNFHPGCVQDPPTPPAVEGNWINKDPGYRGIGLFGFTTFPVELMEFTIE